MYFLSDISPINAARERFLSIVADHFIRRDIVQLLDSEADYTENQEQDKMLKRKSREVTYEGDPRCVNPLIYAANIYQTLVNEVNIRLASLDGFGEKTIGVDLEASGGLYMRLEKKFPREGSYTISFASILKTI